MADDFEPTARHKAVLRTASPTGLIISEDTTAVGELVAAGWLFEPGPTVDQPGGTYLSEIGWAWKLGERS